MIITFLTQAPSGDFHAVFLAGLTVASGLPRFVIVIVPPRSPTSSNRERHLALNSVTPTIRCFTAPASQHQDSPYWSGHLTTCEGMRPRPQNDIATKQSDTLGQVISALMRHPQEPDRAFNPERCSVVQFQKLHLNGPIWQLVNALRDEL